MLRRQMPELKKGQLNASERKLEMSEFTRKITEGLKKSFDKLVREKAKEDGELIFSENGKIVRVKAKELLKKL